MSAGPHVVRCRWLREWTFAFPWPASRVEVRMPARGETLIDARDPARCKVERGYGVPDVAIRWDRGTWTARVFGGRELPFYKPMTRPAGELP